MRRKRVVALGVVAGVALLLWYLFEYGVPAGTATVYVDGKPTQFPVYKPIFFPGGTVTSEDGWIHVKGDATFVVMIPNYTRVVVEVKVLSNPENLTIPVTVYRFCGWNEEIQAYGRGLSERRPKVEFIGCQPIPKYDAKLWGKRYAMTPPGALRIDVGGEVLVKIEAYP
jgi:hypothetical protein